MIIARVVGIVNHFEHVFIAYDGFLTICNCFAPELGQKSRAMGPRFRKTCENGRL